LDDISTAGLLLGLAVSGVRIVDGVSEVVVSWGEGLSDDGFGDGGGISDGSYSSGDWCGVRDGRSDGSGDGSVVGDGGGSVVGDGGGSGVRGDACTGHGEKSGESDKLKKIEIRQSLALITDNYFGHAVDTYFECHVYLVVVLRVCPINGSSQFLYKFVEAWFTRCDVTPNEKITFL
jgi:hypothetical protein